MAVNELSFNQVSTLLNSIVQQATGQATITPTNTSEFVSVAQTALKAGYDPILNAINQVISRTIFSVRPYTRKFRGLEVSETAYGNQVRKLSIGDKPLSDDERYSWPMGYDATKDPAGGDGESVDMYALNKPTILQTNFYGQNVFQDYYTIFRDQLDNAFTGPDQLGSFIGMVSQNMADKLEQSRENMARATLANLIGAILAEKQNDRVIHLLTEYNTLTGQELTAQTVYQPDNFGPFMKFVYSRIASISALMTERSQMFQTVINNVPVMRHTPYSDQMVYIYAPARYRTEAMVLADTYHDNYLRYANVETVNFWQSIETPDSISVTPSYTSTTGALTVPETQVEQAGIYAVIFDREAAGYATTQQWSSPTPFNAAGGYSNIWFHETTRNWNDNTEKAVVFLLD